MRKNGWDGRFPRFLYEEIVAHARSVFPEECCGLVAGDGTGRPVRVIPMENALHSPVRYQMEPREQFQIQKSLRSDGLEMWAIYHSHPETDPFPSETDIRLAFYPDLFYLLTSLKNLPPPLRSFRIRDGLVEEVPLTLVERDKE
ncbi:MAG: M67 family metallopeptidase [Leptospirales bacterium]